MLALASRLTLVLIYLKLRLHAGHPLGKFPVAVSPQPGCRKGALLFLKAIPSGQGWGSYSGVGWAQSSPSSGGQAAWAVPIGHGAGAGDEAGFSRGRGCPRGTVPSPGQWLPLAPAAAPSP